MRNIMPTVVLNMRKILKYLLMLMILSWAISCKDGPTLMQKTPIFLFIGQSNMSGRGEIITRTYSDNIIQVKNDLTVSPAMEPTDSAENEEDEFMNDQLAGQSIVLPFSFKLLERFHKIIVIQCSKGGKRAKFFNTDSFLSVCEKKIKIAQKIGRIDSIIIWQGESDSIGEMSGMWASEYEKIINSFFNIIGHDFKKIIVQITDYNGDDEVRRYNWGVVQDQQKSASLEFDALLLKTVGIEKRGTGSHLKSKGYVEVGNSLASEYLKKYKTNLN